MRLTLSCFARMSSKLQELRIHMCPHGQTSKGVREFVQKSYSALKKDNPDLAILIRECKGVNPRLIARYSMGKEVSVPLTNQTASDIEKTLDAVGRNI